MMHAYPDMSYEAIYQTYADYTTQSNRMLFIHTAYQIQCSDGQSLMAVILEIKKPTPFKTTDINLMM